MSLAATFTLIVPTHDRPAELGRLLRYLARHAFPCPILVLDSGTARSKAASRTLTASLPLNIRLLAYSEDVMPFDKFWRGSEEVTTEFAALCADDDVVFVDSLSPIVEFLTMRNDFAAAHGWYFSFAADAEALDLMSIVYSGPSLDGADPLLRVRDMFDRYEAVTYAVYRSEILRQALRGVQGVASLLARELLAGALTAAMGKVARLPILYYGRSLGRSAPYMRWHPIDFLLSSPAALFEDYRHYRQILFDALTKAGCQRQPSMETLVDLIHLSYFSEYVTPALMRYLIQEVAAGSDRDAIMRGVWPRLVPPRSRIVEAIRLNATLRALRDLFAPGLTLRHLRRLPWSRHRRVQAVTAAGGVREYRVHADFRAALAGIVGAHPINHVDRIIGALNAYE